MYYRKPYKPEIVLKIKSSDAVREKNLVDQIGNFIYAELAEFVKVRFDESIATKEENLRSVANG